jgi:anti-sigma factor RsiW
VSCEPETITAYVDGALDAAARAAVETHLATCAACREQVNSERELRSLLRALPAPPLRDGFEADVRRDLRGRRPRPLRWLLPIAAALAVVALWARGAAPVMAWELARDHAHCFSARKLPAQVWTGDGAVMASWIEKRGRTSPLLPDKVAGLDLVGGRFCPLADRTVAHLYYVGAENHVSLFVVPGTVRFAEAYSTRAHGAHVRLLRVGDSIVGIVGDREEDVAGMEQAFGTTVARAEFGPALP